MTLHMSQNFILTAVLVASCVSFITIPLSGHISDRIGRRKTYLTRIIQPIDPLVAQTGVLA
jgi:MFS family permease